MSEPGWEEHNPQPCAACGEPTRWRDHNGVPLCDACDPPPAA
jgi:hypothetical protein